ncbi:RHS repeat-associated core domain-containing protein [Streptomyces justiciae]|uniref:RHS repeat-associated core domain-containing protein n=1 Tax=Streptomyces justiciae TaxID=2780140 RepID=A0ABU3LX53_9ACTN|nr:RHS repeat-associated core domain-containing protein [Streptomyces justiciae]MDT7843718.1 RHS repeat-associated core domain-containing protein [Streptomyces justiciae]
MTGHRPTDWHVLDLEKDPTPGDPDRIKRLARTLHDFADDVSDALRLVNGMAGEDTLLEWAGKSAEVFKDEFGDVPKNLKKLKKSYELCGDALTDFWPKLERAQALADRALAKGREAQSDLSSANSRLASADSWVTRANKEADKYKDDPTGSKSGGDKPDEGKVRAATRDAQHAKSAQTSAQSDVSNAQSALAAAKKMAEDARKMREEAAHTAKTKIDEASDAGIQNRSWWEEVGDWFSDNWDNIVAVCKIVVAVVGVIAMIIGGPILGAIVLIAALVVLADTLYKYSKGQASLWDVGLAALDCIPGMKGLTTLGGLAKGLKALGKTGLKGMAMGVKGLGPRMKNLGRQMKNLFTCGDPIDMATGQMVMSIIDLSLPGVLPLAIERSHRTGVASGRWFGADWTSTLDQRLLIDDDGARLISADGTVLYYAVPEPGEPMSPILGPTWPLRWDGTRDGIMTVHQPDIDTKLLFRRLPGGPASELSLVGLRDRNDNAIDFLYAEDGSPHEVIHHGGYRLGIDVSAGRITALRLLSAPDRPCLTTYEYDAQGRLIGAVDSSSKPQRYSYDEQHRLTGWQSRIGDWYRYAYDATGRCVRTGGDSGVLAYSYAYDDETRTTRATDSLGQEIAYTFNDDLLPCNETDPLGHTVIRDWDEYGRLVSETDQLGRTTRYGHDHAGNITEVVRPDGGVVAKEYNEFGQVTKVTQPDGSIWESVYDERGNRVAVVDPAGARTTFTLDERGALVDVTDALGQRRQTLVNDAAGLVSETVDALGARNSVVRDAFGRIIELTDPFGAVTRIGWTLEGRISWRRLPNGTTEHWSYDAEGNPLEHRSSNGRGTRFENTHFDLCTLRQSEDGTLERFRYDTELRLRGVTNAAGQEWSYTYDGVGRLISETDFNGRTVTYRYDAAGQLVERTNGAGQVTGFRHDILGNVVAMETDGSTTTYEYDPLGRLVRAQGPDVELRREHDAVGRMLAESWNGHAVHSEYDLIGRRVERRTPSGAVTRWSYDVERRSVVQRSGQNDVAFRYDVAGREIERALGDVARLAHEWDAERLRTTQALAAAAGEVRRRTFQHRPDGMLASVTDPRLGVRTFTFDAAGRVTAARYGDGGRDESYRFDVLGNLTEFTSQAVRDEDEEAGTGERTYFGSLIERAGRTRYRHDGQGRVIKRTTKLLSGGVRVWRYRWNAEDQLTDVLTPDGRHWRYLYDPVGRRVAKLLLADDGTTVVEQVSFFWDGDNLAEQTDGTASTSWDWTDGPTPVSQRVRDTGPIGPDSPQHEIDERFYAIVTDLIGTPTELVDADGAVAWTQSSTIWGVPTERPDAQRVDCPLRFPGQYYDDETGLHYNHHRYYEPGTARYLSPDPLGRTPAPNHYAYVKNPLQWKDPLGLKSPCMVDLYHGTTGSAADSILARGIDPRFKPRKMDFGAYGFYVTNNPKQAVDWAKRLATRNSDVPAVLHFRVPKSELDKLNSKIFDGPSDELADFIRHHRSGGDMHGYDMVEGPMLRNVPGFLKGDPGVFNGHQIAIFTDRAAQLFDNSFVRRVGP